MSIRVMLVDDHRMVRESLQGALAEEPDLTVMAGAGSAAEALALLEHALPDVLVLDIALGDINGIEVARQVAKRYPEVRVLALSGYAERIFVEEMLKAGAFGYVVKSSGVAGLAAAIRAVAQGQRFLSPEAATSVLGHLGQAVALAAPPVTVLTRREQEVLRLIAEGRRCAQIADELAISPMTVEVHRRNLKRKLGLNSTADLTRYALREGVCSAG